MSQGHSYVMLLASWLVLLDSCRTYVRFLHPMAHSLWDTVLSAGNVTTKTKTHTMFTKNIATGNKV